MPLVHLCAAGLVATCPPDYWQLTLWIDGDPVYIYPGESLLVPGFVGQTHFEVWPDAATEYDLPINVGGRCDVNMDGDGSTDKDIEAFFGAFTCPDQGCASVADWDNDGAAATTEDIMGFFQDL